MDYWQVVRVGKSFWATPSRTYQPVRLHGRVEHRRDMEVTMKQEAEASGVRQSSTIAREVVKQLRVFMA